MNKLNLFVENSKKFPEGDEDDTASSEGFIKFVKQDIKKEEFSILVKRINDVEE